MLDDKLDLIVGPCSRMHVGPMVAWNGKASQPIAYYFSR